MSNGASKGFSTAANDQTQYYIVTEYSIIFNSTYYSLKLVELNTCIMMDWFFHPFPYTALCPELL